MTYKRVVERNRLAGNYTGKSMAELEGALDMIGGDLRRLEKDAVDGGALTLTIADKANVSPENVQLVLKAFFAT